MNEGIMLRLATILAAVWERGGDRAMLQAFALPVYPRRC
jgi:hypothetical protein